jgi:hypothetical protein
MSGGVFITDSLSEGLAIAEVEVPKKLEENVLAVAIQALAFAKEQASWTDRTGDAREGLDTDVVYANNSIIWSMYHTVDYGLWLETIQSGRFSVIMPTLELFASRIGDHLSEDVEGVDYG